MGKVFKVAKVFRVEKVLGERRMLLYIWCRFCFDMLMQVIIFASRKTGAAALVPHRHHFTNLDGL